jgi:hypothetical protein
MSDQVAAPQAAMMAANWTGSGLGVEHLAKNKGQPVECSQPWLAKGSADVAGGCQTVFLIKGHLLEQAAATQGAMMAVNLATSL